MLEICFIKLYIHSLIRHIFENKDYAFLKPLFRCEEHFTRYPLPCMVHSFVHLIATNDLPSCQAMNEQVLPLVAEKYQKTNA